MISHQIVCLGNKKQKRRLFSQPPVRTHKIAACALVRAPPICWLLYICKYLHFRLQLWNRQLGHKDILLNSYILALFTNKKLRVFILIRVIVQCTYSCRAVGHSFSTILCTQWSQPFKAPDCSIISIFLSIHIYPDAVFYRCMNLG